MFGTVDICSTFFSRVKTLFYPPDTFDNVNISLVPYSNQAIYALTETNFLVCIDPKDLTIINRINLTDHIPTATTTNSHPHVDEDGSWLIAGINVSNRLKRPKYEFIKYESTQEESKLNNICKNGKVICSIPSGRRFGLSYFHSFGITENYIIFLEQSIKISFAKLIMTALRNKAFSNCMVTQKDWPTRIHIINKETGELLKQKYITEPLIAFHHINAYEKLDSNKNTELIVDLCAYDPATFDLNKFTRVDMYTERLSESDLLKSTAKRLLITLNEGKIIKDPIYCHLRDINSKLVFELPCINYSRFNGLKYKYLYGTNYFKKPFSIIKLNVEDPSETFEKKYEEEGKDFLPSEPVFVEKPNPESEDDGVILVLVLSKQNDYLSILDAKNLNEIAKAVIENDVQAAFTFHGFFASAHSACNKIFEMS